jgi:transposase InsO family protein
VSCRLLGVSRSGYYEWKDRPLSAREQDNQLLLKHIKQVHADSRGSYGSPRVHAELTLGLGLVVNEKRVARLMRQAGIRGLYVRRRRGCTVRNPDAEPAGDLVNRQFAVTAPDRLWLTDITEHPTTEGTLYCAAVMDAYSRRIIGWSMAPHIRTELVLDALGMDVLRRTPKNGETILHSDHGNAIYVMGLRATNQQRRTARLDGQRRRLLRHDGIVLGNPATRSPGPKDLEFKSRACQRHLRMDRVLVQPEQTPFQHRNAQSG